ncbi:MAG: hypothetical protein LWW75_07815 [Chlorobiales bacterium]|nr:hypothetical protein [Chlorobiales bacterium]
MTSLNRNEKIHHIDEYGDKCPCCDSTEIVTENTTRACGTITLERSCKDCGAEWSDTYELTDVHLVRESAA